MPSNRRGRSYASLAARLGLLAWLAAAVALAPAARHLSGPALAALGLALLALLPGLLRLADARAFGPVAYYDMLRAARRPRYFILRGAFAALAGFALAYGVAMVTLLGPAEARPDDLTNTIDSFFYAFMSGQLAAVAFVTPALAAGCLAEEKERQTLQFALATDLRDGEIVAGKYASRAAAVSAIVLGGLPVLSLILILGGIDPAMLLSGYVLTLGTVVGLTGTSVLASALARRTRDAIVIAYLLPVAYTLATSFAQVIRFAWWSRVPVGVPGYQVTLVDALDVLCRGNLPLTVTQALELRFTVGAAGADDALELVLSYTAYQFVVAASCVWLSTLVLRPAAMHPGAPARRKRRSGRGRGAAVRSCGDSPVFWKEAIVEGGLRVGLVGRLLLFAVVGFSFLPVIFILYDALSYGHINWLGRQLNTWARLVGAAAGCLVLIGIGTRAAGTVTGEREKQTLDALLTSPLPTERLLDEKWAGVVYGFRGAWLWPGLVWLMAMPVGGLTPLALAVSVPALVVYTRTAAWAGVHYSVTAGTTLRATVYTALTLLLMGGGYMVFVCMCCAGPLAVADIREPELMDEAGKLVLSASPPAVLWDLAPEFGDERELLWGSIGSRNRGIPFLFYVALSLGAWFAAGSLFRGRAIDRFRELTGRDLTIPPERRDGP